MCARTPYAQAGTQTHMCPPVHTAIQKPWKLLAVTPLCGSSMGPGWGPDSPTGSSSHGGAEAPRAKVTHSGCPHELVARPDQGSRRHCDRDEPGGASKAGSRRCRGAGCSCPARPRPHPTCPHQSVSPPPPGPSSCHVLTGHQGGKTQDIPHSCPSAQSIQKQECRGVGNPCPSWHLWSAGAAPSGGVWFPAHLPHPLPGAQGVLARDRRGCQGTSNPPPAQPSVLGRTQRQLL